MLRASLLDFLTTGALGALRLEISAADVESALGRPEATGGSSRKYKWPSIWKYGAIELAFDPKRRSLIYIAITFAAAGKLSMPAHIQIDPDGIAGDMLAEDFARLLGNNGLPYRELPQKDDEVHELLVADRVLAVFLGERRADKSGFRLQKLISHRLGSKPADTH
jgi:hypothetical protein